MAREYVIPGHPSIGLQEAFDFEDLGEIILESHLEGGNGVASDEYVAYGRRIVVFDFVVG
ncbi:MAG: hypothetical protein GWN87_12345 [Desulfuromonadales bacterium]|nr:hypothetical protein [Desulfuromonadales bacterium]